MKQGDIVQVAHVVQGTAFVHYDTARVHSVYSYDLVRRATPHAPDADTRWCVICIEARGRTYHLLARPENMHRTQVPCYSMDGTQYIQLRVALPAEYVPR